MGHIWPYLADTKPPVFRRIGAPTPRELQALVERIAERIGGALERQGLLARDCDNSFLTLEAEAGDAMDDLLGRCGGKLKVIASIEDPVLIERILARLERPATADDTRSPVAPRAPPQPSLL